MPTLAPLPTSTPTPTPDPSGNYKDGSYVGQVADAQWGLLQVKAIVSNGQISDVQFLQYPSDRSRSVRINSVADPILRNRGDPGAECTGRHRQRRDRLERGVHPVVEHGPVPGTGVAAPPMKQCRLLMGMPITVEILDDEVTVETFDEVFSFFQHVDETFSTYRDSSEISRINRGELAVRDSSMEVRSILALSEQSRHETQGFFDVQRNGQIDPSGVVKGWAVQQAANQLAPGRLQQLLRRRRGRHPGRGVEERASVASWDQESVQSRRDREGAGGD